jgi:hypothetical protein
MFRSCLAIFRSQCWCRAQMRETQLYVGLVRCCGLSRTSPSCLPTAVASTYFFVHTRQYSTHPQSTEALNAGTSPIPDLSYSNRSSEPARHTIVFLSFVHDINIVTWRWPSTAETCSRYCRNKYQDSCIFDGPYFLLLIYILGYEIWDHKTVDMKSEITK